MPELPSDLAGADLTRADLAGADLSGRDLRGAKLGWANLRGANLHGATLDDCELLGADLSDAELGDASARHAGFGGATLDGARLFQADLAGSTFSRATLRRCDLRAARLEGARLIEATLDGADLSNSKLADADLRDASVAGGSLAGADLRRAHLRGLRGYAAADWHGADIREVDFCGAYLIRRHIIDENYLYELRHRSRWHRGIYTLWWLTSDCGRSLLRWSLWTALAVALFAAAYSVVGIDPGPHPTALSPLYFSVVTVTTLGFGDVLPATPAAQLIVMVQVVVGYLALGGLLSIFANKMARRGD